MRHGDSQRYAQRRGETGAICSRKPRRRRLPRWSTQTHDRTAHPPPPRKDAAARRGRHARCRHVRAIRPTTCKQNGLEGKKMPRVIYGTGVGMAPPAHAAQRSPGCLSAHNEERMLFFQQRCCVMFARMRVPSKVRPAPFHPLATKRRHAQFDVVPRRVVRHEAVRTVAPSANKKCNGLPACQRMAFSAPPLFLSC